MDMSKSSRNPYPFPQIQNDDDFVGQNTVQKGPYNDPTHLAQRKDPWNRLNSTCTLASARREVFHYDPRAPHDSLDFVLKADYNHHGQFLNSKAETLHQLETFTENHGRILKNRVKEEEREFDPMSPPLRRIEILNPKREDINSIEGAIESHHSAQTNNGYSRKHDGGFYTT
ncbi:protein CFAP276-like [Antedon mediterranea]|uniref:protein CFAP276-like n=1 Tax=Antedon mediterranea TaxID=105859 RepID=UPI003AF8487E